jgi:ribosomal protein L11 methyltransferase
MHKTYQELSITLEDRFVDLISDFVANIYGDGIEIGEGEIIVRSENDLHYVKEAVEALADTLGDTITLVCKITEKENNDWIQTYQDSVQPIEAGTFYIHPSWSKPKESLINIVVDPALAFGSGHHGTTFSCLEAIGTYVAEGDALLDVGCGSGILGLAARKLGAVVDLCDTDPLSVESTQENFNLNQETYDTLWEGSVNKTDKKYDIVIANIIPDVLKAIATGLQKAVKDDGLLIISGILDRKEPAMLKAYHTLTLLERKQKDEWVTLIYKKETNG